MKAAKIPDSGKSNWENVDIFLFRNGENAVPPRKYHLKSEELENWDNTLKSIAQTQYGTSHSLVDLYTTSGDKITTPIEIQDNSFYVAVPPQTDFIAAGYNEYILKASRSREKRQGKIKKPINEILPETEEHITTESNEKEENDSKLTQNNGADSNNSSLENQTTSQPKDVTENTISNEIPNDDAIGKEEKESKLPHSVDSGSKKESSDTRRTSQSKKATDRKILNQAPNNSPLLRKNNDTIPPPKLGKTSFKKPEDSVKNLPKTTVKINTNRNVSKDQVITNLNNPLRSRSKEVSRTGKTNSFVLTSKKFEKPSSNEVTYTPTIIDEDSITTERPIIDNVMYDKELIVVKNPDSMVLDANTGVSLLSRPIVNLSEIATLPLLEEYKPSKEGIKDIPNNVAGNVYTPDMRVYNLQPNQNNGDATHYKTIGNPELQNPNDANNNKTIDNNKGSTENMIAIIDKGDIVDFNLKLELKKCNGVIKTKCTDGNVQFLGKTHSQTEAKEVLKEPLNNSQNIVNVLSVDDKNAKIIVVTCSCCGHENFDEILHALETSSKPDENKYVVLITNPDNEKPFQRCSCEREDNKSIQADIDNKTFSIINPITKEYATTSVLTETDKDKTDDGTEFEMNDVKFSRTQSILRNYNEAGISRESSSRNNSLPPCLPRLMGNLDVKGENKNSITTNAEEPNTSKVETKESNTLSVRKNASFMTTQMIDKSTQTEWASLLLEAKRHEDGRYSFHIPPLSVIKFFFR